MPATLNPRYTFPEFVVGRSNEAAYAAASAAAVAPGQLYNPILIVGATGLGKTHLAHAVVAEASLRPGRRVRLLSADEFLRELAAGVAAGTPRAILDSVSESTLLVMDDVHVLDRHSAAQDALAVLVADAVARSCQLLLTSDAAAGADALALRLVSRFRGAHVATLEPPDWEHRVAILRARARSLGLELPPSVANHLAAQCETSVRELEGALTRLLAIAELDGSPLTLALARRAVPTRRPQGGSPNLGAQAVQEAVAAEWGVSPDALVGEGRSRALAQPRRIGMLLCRELLALSLREIGAAFGDRDTSTVLSALARARADLEDDPRAVERVERLRLLLPAGGAAGAAPAASGRS
ncbi:MAG: chromosomal replication initiator protein DnaA [Gemmatimonadetes bacterium]|nr:chromosomal replication initiator protein DnaA [Gemmatimonadota bacterium]